MQIFTQICCIFLLKFSKIFTQKLLFVYSKLIFLLRCQSLPTEALCISRKFLQSLSE